VTLAEKIARLVAERGWSQEAFARAAGLHRHTARQILRRPAKRLRNQTIRQCADALGLQVHELTVLPLEKLLPRMRADQSLTSSECRLLERATQPELQTWMERNPERARALTAAEVDELLSLQGTGGPLTQFGVEHFVKLLERRRELVRRVETIAGTDYLDLLEQLVGLLYDKIQPYKDC
jgi:transcriptional regulator with XRE-family HTH domain